MVALAYNIGLAGFRRSSVLHHHNAGNKAAAGNAFRLWNKAGGKVLAGLTRRREAERLLYLNDLLAFDRAIGYKP
jgi:lysozyme